MASKTLFIILGNQLFPINELNKHKDSYFFMAEDYELCTYEKHHKHKIILFLSSMRKYAFELKNKKKMTFPSNAILGRIEEENVC